MKAIVEKLSKNNALVVSSRMLLAALLLNVSCMPEPLQVDNVPSIKPEIVVSSQVMSDTMLAVILTRTISALDANDDSDPQALASEIAITDAKVTLTVNGKDYVLPHVQDGAYEGKYITLQAGDQCHLLVESPSFGQVSATTTVQPPIYFDSVRAEAYFNGYNDFLAEVTYTLQDPPMQNFYMINVQGAKRDVMIQNIMNPDAYTKLFEDKIFNGTDYSEVFRAAPQDFRPGDSVAVSLANVSSEYYEFLKLRMENKLGLVEMLSEPINYPTNVKGGRGFFNLHLPDVRVMILARKSAE